MKHNIQTSRRNLLKSLAIGGGAITGTKMLPEKWVSPIIESVILPAHALTTGCDDTLTIIEDMHACSNTQTNEIQHYIDDSEGCPVVQIGTATGEATPLFIYKYFTPFTVGIGFQVGGDFEEIAVLCLVGDTSDSQDYQKQFLATSGAPWSVTFTLSKSEADKQVSVSNIVLTPV